MDRRHFLLGGLAALASLAGFSWPLYKSFGALPADPVDSPNWINGSFRNLSDNALPWDLSGEKEYKGGWLKFFLSRDGNRYPPNPLHYKKDDLKSLAEGEFVWLGHSSLLLKLDGKIICVDPVLSRRASPVPGLIRAWPGTTPYGAEDFPPIDFLLITHDHWDHLDWPALRSLKYRHILCGRGLGVHLDAWNIPAPYKELDWWQESGEGPRFAFTPSVHFSGRGLTRNKSLWGGFVITGANRRIYITGDGGYGRHFQEIGKRYGPFDLVFPDSGQYNKAWSSVHMFPEQAVAAVQAADGVLACPLHRGRFTLSWHGWDEPEKRFVKEAEKKGLKYMLPVPGEKTAMF